MAKMLGAHPDRAAWIHEWLSQVTGDELRGEGRVYGGGLNIIEPKELARISAKKLLAHWPEISSVTDAQGELFANPKLNNDTRCLTRSKPNATKLVQPPLMRHNHLIDYNVKASSAHIRKRYRKTNKQRPNPIVRLCI